MSADDSVHPAVAGAIGALNRSVRVVDSLDDDQFTRKLLDHDSIGAHLRHCIEYVRVFLAGIDSDSIDYDDRPRDRQLEADRSACRTALEQLKDEIQSIPSDWLEKTVHPKETLSLDHPARSMASTVVRELGYLSQHTVHHLAIITMIADLGGLRLPSELGLACSTAVYRKSLESDS